jgi:transcriptional regulator with XRE-family HTH domain
MGRATPAKPKRLPEKLLQIRQALGLSQNGMLKRLGLPEKLIQTSISGYERGAREPSLLVLLEYAREAGVYLDVLVDDGLDLPKNLPANPKSEGIKRKSLAAEKRALSRKGK